MKTTKILRFTLQVLASAGLLLGPRAFAASSTTFTLITGDASLGLTLDPANVVAARHFGNNNTNYTMQGVSFANNAGRPNSTSFSITGFSGFEYDGFHPGTPTLGTGTTNDLALGAMCNSFYFGSDAGGGFNFKISGLAPFSTNKIEFIHYIGTFGPRNTVITVTNGASSLSETNTELVNKPLNSQFSGIVADSYGSISGRFQQGATPGDGSWINAIIVTFQGQGPVSTFSWSGITNGVPAGNWDVGSTTNWILSLSGNPIAWPNGGITRFDDSAAGTTTVNETTTLAPATLTVSNVAKSYTFTGTGAITGVKLIKQGTGILTVLSTNAFGNGNSEIQNGTVVFGNTSSNNVTGQLLVASVSNVVANLVLTSNANLIVSDAFNLGSSASSTGTVVIANNSVLRKTGGSISIGGAGVGIATIQDSATFTANASDLNIGDLAGSAGTLNLQGSPQITVGGVYVGKGSG